MGRNLLILALIIPTLGLGQNSWIPLGDMSRYPINFIIDPVDTNRIYATHSYGIIKSIDGGANWTDIVLYTSDYTSSIVLNPLYRDTLYIGVEAIGTGGVGVYRSANRGNNWTQVYSAESVSALAIDPQQPHIIYAGTDTNSYTGGAVGILKSTNAGENWTAVNNGLGDWEIQSLAIDPVTPSTIYAGTKTGLYKSTDGGSSWSSSGSGIPSLTTILSIAIHPQDTDTLFVGTYGEGLYKSVDGGANWSASGSGIPNTIIHCILVNPTWMNAVYAGADDGYVYSSRNSGASWSQLGDQPYIGYPAGALGVNALDAQIIFALFDQGTTAAHIYKRVEDFTPPAAPANLTAAPGNQQVTLSWDTNSEADLSHYVVYQGLTSGFDTTGTTDYGTVDPSITISNLSDGTTYYFVVAAVDNDGNQGSASPEAYATTFTLLQQDSLALVALYNSTDGANWTNKTNWLTGPVSSWYGITVSSGRVTEIDLYNNNLVGTIPTEIGNLSALQVLSLRVNNLSGSIPASIGNLPQLWRLWLTGNQLTGGIPSEIGNLSNLSMLELGSNQLSGSIPESIWNLSSLWLLRFRGNQLSGELSTQIGNLSSLGILDIGINQFSGSIPTTIGNLTALTGLDISDNSFSDSIPSSIVNLVNLDYLYIQNNDFDAMPNLSSISGLSTLRMEDNRFTFKDIEPNRHVPSSDFDYTPQDSVGSARDTTVYVGSDLTLEFSVGGTVAWNTYSWEKDGTPDSTISGDSTYTITNINMADAGSYTCSATNDSLPGLILYGRPIHVTVVDTDPPAAPTGLTATPGDQQVTLFWDANSEPDLSHYVVYQGGTSGFDTTGAPAYETVDTTITISNLSNGTTYYFVVAAVDNNGNQSAASLEVNATPFSIIAVLPVQNALNVSRNTDVSVNFDADMNLGSFNANTFIIRGHYTGDYTGSYSYNSGTRTATFDPASDFTVGEVVTVTLTTGIETSTSDPLFKPYEWSFTVEVDGGSSVFSAPTDNSIGDYSLAVCAADLDGDGDLDLVATSENSAYVSVLLSNGDGTFQTRVKYYVWTDPESVLAADLDGDGDLDLATANDNSDIISVLLGNGDGTFQTRDEYSTGTNPRSVLSADLDGDGNLDLATANVATDNVSVLLGNGDGTFAAHTTYTATDDPYHLSAADLDDDGDYDLVTANFASDNVSVLLGNGDGTFAAQVKYNVAGDSPNSVLSADLDGDGDLDLATTNVNSSDVSVLLGNGDGTFATATIYDADFMPGDAYAADLNGDGDLDLVMPIKMADNVSVLLGNGDGTFAAPTSYLTGDSPRSVAAADLDGDGDLDLATANWGSTDVSVLWNINDATPPLVPTNLTAIPGDGQISLKWDANSEGDLYKYNIYRDTSSPASTLVDSVVGSPPDTFYTDTGLTNGQEYFYRITAVDAAGNESGYSAEDSETPVSLFTKITTGPPVNDGGFSDGVSWVDYDNDGDLDLFVVNNGNNFLYANNNDGTFTRVITGPLVSDGSSSKSGSWGDYDNDGDLDLFVANSQDEDNLLYANNGDGTFTPITSGPLVSDGGDSFGAAWGDYDNDGNLDLFVANDGENNFLYANNGDGTFTKVTTGPPVSDGGFSGNAAWGDYNDDGDLDLFVANCCNDNNFLYTNNGDGTFTKVTTGPPVSDGGDSKGASWGDYDNDGDLDLFVTNIGSNFLYTNNGDGTFTLLTAGPLVDDGGESYGASWGDYDNDGDLDLFVANSTHQDNFLYANNGDGTFTKVTTGTPVSNQGLSQGASWGDYDNDGDLDLFVANYSDQNNFLYSNNGNAHHWIDLRLVGTQSNVSAIGTKVRLKAAIFGTARWQLREISGQTGWGSQNSLNAEFGLGDATVIDSIQLEWPSGLVQMLTGVAVDRFLTITESDVLPAAPTNLTATPGNQKVTLRWSPNTESDLGAYRIYRDLSSPASTLVHTVSGTPPDTFYVDTGLTNDQEYFYCITAVDTLGHESDFSTEVNATPVHMTVSIHVATTGDDGNSGTAGAPLRNIQTALNQAETGDVIRVAGGTYAEALTTSVQVLLMGGYDETFSDEVRDLIAHKTILRPTSGYMFDDAYGSRLEGFVLDGGALTTGTRAIALSGGGFGTITHNIITNIHTSGSYGIYLAGGTGAYIRNNTIYGNTLSGGGVIFYAIKLLATADPATRVENNIIVNNNVGIANDLGAGVADYNNVFDHTYRSYDGIYDTPGVNDLSAAPKFVNAAAGDLRLKGGSPCIDAGNPADDVGSEPEPNGGRINMGAYGGTAQATTSVNPVTYVSPEGDDSNDGTLASPYRSIQFALQNALGDTIKVAAGTYTEGIVTTGTAVLWGGYPTDFSETWRNPGVFRSVVEAISATMYFDAYGVELDGLVFNGGTVAETGMVLEAPCKVSHTVVCNMNQSFGWGVQIDASVVFINNVIYNTVRGLDLGFDADGTVVKNNILADNVFAFINDAAAGVGSYNDLFGNSSNYTGLHDSPGVGDVSLDPQFVDAEGGDFRLEATSLCIDRGDPDPLYNDPDGTRNDMGAYYYQPPIDYPPAAPQWLGATSGAGQISLSWQANTEPDLAKYRIYRDMASPASTLLDSVVGSPPGTDYTDTGLNYPNVYYYHITAVDAGGHESGYSNEVSATPFSPLQLDSLALVALYDNTGGDNWTDRSNWKTEQPLDTWYGVTVSGERVTGLNLSNNNLSAAIPETIGDLIGLTTLSLAANQLTGSIPPVIGNLVQLSELHLSYNSLSGSVPVDLWNLINLEQLFLNDNQLSGTLPPEIGNLIQLQNLDLHTNNFTGSLPSELGNLTTLEQLNLINNTFTGSIPSEIGNLTSLAYLYLRINQLSGTIPEEIGNLTALISLQLGSNLLEGPVPTALADLITLTYLTLDDNRLTALPNLSSLPGLTTLYVERNRFTFKDIEPNLGIASEEYTYAPQDSVGMVQDTTVVVGSDLTLELSVGGTVAWNIYTWEKDGNPLGEPITGDSTYTISPLEFADAGTYTCSATNDSLPGLTLYGRPIHVTVRDTVPPEVPANLTATPGDGQVTLTWSPNSEEDLSHYLVYQGLTSGFDTSGAAVTRVDQPDANVTLTELDNGTTYYFFLIAVDSWGNGSELSQEVNATPQDWTPPAVPANLTAEAGFLEVTLSWSPNTEPDLAYYVVYQSTALGFEPVPNDSVAKVDPPDATVTITGLMAGLTYYYRLLAVDMVGNRSGYSDEAFAVPISPYPKLVSRTDPSQPLEWRQATVTFSFDLDLDPSTVTSSSVVVGDISDRRVPRDLLYDTQEKQISVAWSAPLVSHDTLTITLVADNLASPGGYLLDGNENGVDDGSPADDIVTTYRVAPYGDFNTSSTIDFDDLVLFTTAWYTKDYVYELGPSIGTVPHLVMTPDNQFNLRDLITFIRMWDWYSAFALPLAKAAGAAPIFDPAMTYEWDQLNVCMAGIKGLAAVHLQVTYPPDKVVVFPVDSAHSGFNLTLQRSWREEGVVELDAALPLVAGATHLAVPLHILGREAVEVGIYLEAVDQDGRLLGYVDRTFQLNPVPLEFALHQNFPNPFNPRTTIQYDLPKPGPATLTVYDLLGRQVVNLVDATLEAGYYEVAWGGTSASGSTLPSGIYLVRLTAVGYTRTIKTLLLK